MNARRLLPAVVASLALLTANGFVVAPAAFAAGEEGCANEAIRTSQDASALPECRAWELVTPAEKDNVEARVPDIALNISDLEGISGFVGSVTGNRMAWDAEETLAGAKSVTGAETVGTEYLSTRGERGWSTEDVIPRQSVEAGLLCSYINTGTAGYTADLSKVILAIGAGQNYKGVGGAAEEDCGHNEPAVAPEEPEGFQNLFVRDNDLLSYQLVDVTPKDVAPDDAQFDAGSADLSHVAFDEDAPLTNDAPAGTDLYESSGGAVHLVTYLPEGKPVQGSLPWDTGWESDKTMATELTHTVSADGSRVFFQAEGNLYVRENGATADPATVQLDASQGSGPGGGGRFMAASVDGSKVFFTDDASAGLTADTVAGSGENLYEYELSAEVGKPGVLVDLTAGSSAPGVLGLTATSEDGSYAYFVAEGDLASGAKASQPNLYVVHSGVTTFIGALGGEDFCDWDANCLTARVSPSGRYLSFTSVESLTGYDNDPATPGVCAIEEHSGESCTEIYLYDAGENKLSCASCNPTGARPTSITVIRTPADPSISTLLTAGHLSRNVTDGGQVFFDTLEGLVPHDNNGRRDVYEYKEGHDYLLSSGTQAGESYFLDASERGSDVFFTTSQQLVRADTDESYDIYDVRVGGGFLEQGSQPECADEGCRGLASNPPVLSLPDSASLVSSGNLTPVAVVSPKAKPKSRSVKCKKGYVKRKGKCVKRHRAKAKKSAKGRK